MAWTRPRSGPKGLRHTAYYRDPAGRTRSAGTFADQRRALAAAIHAEGTVAEGTWFDRTAGRIALADYVETVWHPSLHLEITTLAGYRSYLDKHFLPHFGPMPMGDILPSYIQAWVTAALDAGLARRSVVKFHVLLHGIFQQAVRDRVIPHNPAAGTRLPKVVTKPRQILRPGEFQTLLAKIPERLRRFCTSTRSPTHPRGSAATTPHPAGTKRPARGTGRRSIRHCSPRQVVAPVRRKPPAWRWGCRSEWRRLGPLAVAAAAGPDLVRRAHGLACYSPTQTV